MSEVVASRSEASPVRPSRLQQRLRGVAPPPTAASQGAAATGYIECRWVTGTLDPRYEFRAVPLAPGNQRRVIARSPVFVGGGRPVRPTVEARAALDRLCESLHAMGWRVLAADAAGHWYELALEQTDDTAI